MPSYAPTPCPRIYLAGDKSDWRDDLYRRWHCNNKARTVDPFTDCRQGALYLFTHDDLEAIRACDLVFGYCTYERFDGMALEFGFAHALGKPIIFATEHKRVPSMMAAVSQAVFTDFWTAVEFVEERYLHHA